MSLRHHTEVFYDDPTRTFGWQCFTCGQERVGCLSIGVAEVAADAHEDDAA